MAHFGFLIVDAMGHLLSAVPLARELRSRGHRVTFVTSRRMEAPIQDFGFSMARMPPEAERLLRPPPPRLAYLCRRLVGRDLLARWYRFPNRTRMFLEYAPPLLREQATDFLLVDQHVFSGGTVAECLGLPFATVCPALHEIGEPDVPPATTGWRYAQGIWPRWRNRAGYRFWEWYVRPSMRVVDGFRERKGLPSLGRFDRIYSPLASICQSCPEFDYPRKSLPATFHYAGALALGRGCGPLDFPWERLDGRPLVYASLGTIRTNRKPALFRLIAEACIGLGVQLVVSAGRWNADEPVRWLDAGSLPGDPLVLPFVPQAELLRKATLVITHAGLNTVLEALGRGLPMVALPQAGDQFGAAGRIEHAGVGIRVRSRQTNVAGVRAAVQRVLGEESFRRQACRIQEALAATGGVRHAADIVEQACGTREPVLRAVPGR